MITSDMGGVDFITANTDAQALVFLRRIKLQQAINLLRVWAQALILRLEESCGEDQEKIAASIEGADMIFITAGMGGGTGTGAVPVIAQLAKKKVCSLSQSSQDHLVLKDEKRSNSRRRFKNLRNRGLPIVIPNDLFQIATQYHDGSFGLADNILRQVCRV